mmetsp:Transcript_16373/g.35638  ORF Transcript_16373/g.35638 Transcript_16373/m.35638 type:complete len:97 (-) Transcript_16373:1333-1623(-)
MKMITMMSEVVQMMPNGPCDATYSKCFRNGVVDDGVAVAAGAAPVVVVVVGGGGVDDVASAGGGADGCDGNAAANDDADADAAVDHPRSCASAHRS